MNCVICFCRETNKTRISRNDRSGVLCCHDEYERIFSFFFLKPEFTQNSIDALVIVLFSYCGPDLLVSADRLHASKTLDFINTGR